MPFKRTQREYDEESLHEYAIRALGRQMRTVAELKRLLRRKVGDQLHGQLLVDVVIARLKERKYLNDTAYAESYSRFRRDNQKFGPRRVTQDLKIKGVHAEIIEKTVSSTYDAVSEEQLARAFLLRKRIAKPVDQKQAARVFRTLIRAGFSSRVIFRILKTWNVDAETISTLESAAAESAGVNAESEEAGAGKRLHPPDLD